MAPRIAATVLLAIAAAAILSLVSGAPWLGVALPGGLPLGNALAAVGLCAAAGAAVRLSRRGTRLRVAATASLASAAAWLPVSVALAGNLALDFNNGRGMAWMIASAAVLIAILCTLLWALGAALLAQARPIPGQRRRRLATTSVNRNKAMARMEKCSPLLLAVASMGILPPAAAAESGIEIHFIDSAQAVARWADDCIAGGEFAAIATRSAGFADGRERAQGAGRCDSIGDRLVSERMAREPKFDLAAMSAADSAEFLPPVAARTTR